MKQPTGPLACGVGGAARQEGGGDGGDTGSHGYSALWTGTGVCGRRWGASNVQRVAVRAGGDRCGAMAPRRACCVVASSSAGRCPDPCLPACCSARITPPACCIVDDGSWGIDTRPKPGCAGRAGRGRPTGRRGRQQFVALRLHVLFYSELATHVHGVRSALRSVRFTWQSSIWSQASAWQPQVVGLKTLEPPKPSAGGPSSRRLGLRQLPNVHIL